MRQVSPSSHPNLSCKKEPGGHSHVNKFGPNPLLVSSGHLNIGLQAHRDWTVDTSLKKRWLYLYGRICIKRERVIEKEVKTMQE